MAVAELNSTAALSAGKAVESGIEAPQGNGMIIPGIGKLLARNDEGLRKAPVPARLEALQPIAMTHIFKGTKDGAKNVPIGAT